MPIPAFNQNGFLPTGIHPCDLEEIKLRFGTFRRSSRRPELFERLKAYVEEVRTADIAERMVINGSFVTAKEEPNDIDLILVVRATHDLEADLNPAAYNVMSKRRVNRRFGFDLLVARAGSLEYLRWTEFFQQVRLEPGVLKGILELSL